MIGTTHDILCDEMLMTEFAHLYIQVWYELDQKHRST